MVSLPDVSLPYFLDGHLYSHPSAHPSERSGARWGKRTCRASHTAAPRVTGGNLPSGIFLTGGGARDIGLTPSFMGCRTLAGYTALEAGLSSGAMSSPHRVAVRIQRGDWVEHL